VLAKDRTLRATLAGGASSARKQRAAKRKARARKAAND